VLTRFPLLVRLSAMALIVMFPALLPAGGCDESRARGENDADSQYSATGAYLGRIWWAIARHNGVRCSLRSCYR
jgi:hypothetical protein